MARNRSRYKVYKIIFRTSMEIVRESGDIDLYCYYYY